MSEGKLQYGQEVDRELSVVTPYTQQMADTTTGNALVTALTANTEVRPNDRASSLVRTFSPNTTAYDAFSAIYPNVSSFNLPPVLKGFVITWETSSGTGAYNETGSGASTGTSAELSIALQGSGQGSASVVPDLQPDIEETWTRDVPSIQVGVLLPLPVSSTSVLLTKLTTVLGAPVLAWPRFRPRAHIITLFGRKVSVSARASAQSHSSFSDSNTSATQGQGEGTSVDIAHIIRTYRIPPTIHAALTLVSPVAPNIPAVAHASANVVGGVNFGGVSSSSAIAINATGRIVPTALAATTITAIPTTGFYLLGAVSSFYKDGYLKVLAEVIDFSVL